MIVSKHIKWTIIVSILLAIFLIPGMACADDEEMIFSSNDMIEVLSQESWPITDGVTEYKVTMKYTTGYTDGSNSVSAGAPLLAYAVKIEKDSKTLLVPSIGNYYTEGSTAATRANKAKRWKVSWGGKLMTVSDQAAAYESIADPQGQVIAAINGDLSSGGIPNGKLNIEGNVLCENTLSNGLITFSDNGNYHFDWGSASAADVTNAIGSWGPLVIDGGNGGLESETDTQHRSAIAETYDGSIVFIAIPKTTNSAGIGLYYLADFIADSGYKTLHNFDGGRSTTLLTKRADEESFSRKTPLIYYGGDSGDYDGIARERPVSSSLLLIKTECVRGNEHHYIYGEGGKVVCDRCGDKAPEGTVPDETAGYYDNVAVSGYYGISTDKELYKPGEAIKVKFRAPLNDDSAWVGIYKKDQTPNQYIKFRFVRDISYGYDITGGTTLEDGDYSVAILPNNGYTVSASVDVSIHNWDEGNVVKEATCGETGEISYTCLTCGETRTQPIPATGEHTWNEGEITTEPTCTGSGIKTFTCTTCGETHEEEVEALGHDYQDVPDSAIAASCFDDGKEADQKCSRCDDVITGEVIPAIGHHTWDDGAITTEPTCADPGIKTFTCTICGETQTEAVEAYGHDYHEVGGTAIEATCTEDGKEADQECSRCHDLITGKEIKATGHKYFMDESSAKEPTCTEDGYKAGYKCSKCGDLIKGATIKATGHDYHDVDGSAKEATCGAPGKEADRKCSVCGDTITGKTIPATGNHTWDEGKVTTEATAEAEGEMTYSCTVCGETRTEAIPKLDPIVVTPETIKVTLSKKTYVYDGKNKTPGVTVKADGVKLTSDHYDVTYSKKTRKAVGKYTVTVDLKNGYAGTGSAEFVIKPIATKIVDLKGIKKGFTIKYSKVTKQATGYEIWYSTSKTFKSKKTITVKKYKTVTQKVTKLKAKKYYFVKVRTYKTVNGKPIYSAWSKVKKVKTL